VRSDGVERRFAFGAERQCISDNPDEKAGQLNKPSQQTLYAPMKRFAWVWRILAWYQLSFVP
jgi:hypothetical protein